MTPKSQGPQREEVVGRAIMSIPEPLNPRIPSARRLARKFTPNTPFHHPHLDPKLDPGDLHLVPRALFPGRKLNWEIPRPAVTNLHVMLKLTNDPDELLEDFHSKIPQIDDVLRLWGQLKGKSPSTTGEAQLWTRIPGAENRGWTSAQHDEGTIFNRFNSLDTTARADDIYLNDDAKYSVEHAEHASVPPNLRTRDWSDFDDSYVHVDEAELKMVAFPKEQSFDFGATPSNLRITEWLDDERYTDPASEAHNSEPDRIPRQIGPYETFWMNHDPYGRLALKIDEGESSSSTSQ